MKRLVIFFVPCVFNCQFIENLYFLRRCECRHKQFDLKEVVVETQQILNETQQMVKVGSKWLKALYEAHLEENHTTSKPRRCFVGPQGVEVECPSFYEAHKCEDGKMHCQNDNQCGANGKCIFQ